MSLAETAKLFCNIKFATQVVMGLVPEDLIAINPMLGKVSHQIQGKLKPRHHSGTFWFHGISHLEDVTSALWADLHGSRK